LPDIQLSFISSFYSFKNLSGIKFFNSKVKLINFPSAEIKKWLFRLKNYWLAGLSLDALKGDETN